MQKLYDLVVKVGEYQNSQGETKGRYENVGSLMQKEEGQFLILKRTFNPTGVPNPDCKDSVLISCFTPKDNNQQQQQRPQQQQPQQNNQQQQPQSNNGYDPSMGF